MNSSNKSTAKYNIVQVAYHVPNIHQAALHMAENFSAGPFFVVPQIQLKWGQHRGQECNFVHSSAYGQWGNVMMELVQQDSSHDPSPFRDLFDAHQQGLHHTAVMVDDMAEAYQHFEQQKIFCATKAMTLTDTEFAFLDATQQMGHFIEIYAKSPGLLGFYNMVKEAAENWRGDAPIRELPKST